MTPNPPPERWWLILLRHFTTILALLAGFWWLAIPRVEAFIQNAVNDRILRVETTLDVHSRQLQSIIERLATVQDTQKELMDDRVSPGGQRQ